MLGFALLVGLSGCGSDGTGPAGADGAARAENLAARPRDNVTTIAPGTYVINLDPGTANLIVPSTVSRTNAVPFVLMLHGAFDSPAGVAWVNAYAEQYGFVVLAPKSKEVTWDAGRDSIGPDVVRLNRVLNEVFDKVRVDPKRVAVAGFSDGASYALTLGIANGRLFTHVMAFSAGFIFPVTRQGKPGIFIAHGREDAILDIETTRDNIVPFLRMLGYSVTYEEFQGGHQINSAAADKAFDWFLEGT